MNKDILKFCNNNEYMNNILKLFTEDFFFEYNEFSPKEKRIIVKAIPYFYRIWYYSSLVDNTPLSPSNFINLQVQDKFGEKFRVVPIINPIYKNRTLKEFKYEYKLFTIDNHPVLEDIKLFLEYCSPDVGIDESGLLLEEERNKIINKLTFKEIFYVTFLTNIAYELNLIKKMPSIGTYRAMQNLNNVNEFFSLSKIEQLKKIVAAIISNASKILLQSFNFDRSTFSKKALFELFSNSQNLNEYSYKIFKKFNIDIDISSLSELLFKPISESEIYKIPEERFFGIALSVEFSFIMDAYLLTPLGHYLQFIQPIYNNRFDFLFSFEQLIQADISNIPLIKLYFIMANGFDITPLGKEILLDGNSPKNEFQRLIGTIDFKNIYEEIINYVEPEVSIDDFEDDYAEVLNFEDFKALKKEIENAHKKE
ncbi:hypothetical protein SAMN05428976_10362 [Clostridium sp. USBA 49]|uniref:hypothetical protein n=1 Tax=Clostridium sp. USBA 49 TaxID=1881060 RepID=UPI000999F772|nr:hypothetical protein [Clostridium sp. USBA 49]SKA78317.1 hypothetical protein SAMN05428976_10362 [Clostridium sp. USBA 49]